MRNPDSGAAIVEALVARYGRMRSYQDRGVVKQGLERDPPPLELPFETHFVAPDRFRFSFASPHPFPPLRHVLSWYAAGTAGPHSWVRTQHQDEPAKVETVDGWFAIAALAGVSGGASHVISRLLLKPLAGLSLLDIQGWSLSGETEVDGLPCLQVAGTHPRGERWEILVERDSLLLRSVRTGDDTVQERSSIRVDEPIDHEVFAVPANE